MLFPVPVGPDSVSSVVSVPHLLPVALFPIPALVQPPVFQGEFPRLQLPQNDRHAITIAEPYQWVWAKKSPPVGLFPFPVDPRWRPGRYGSRTASGSWKTRGIHVESADFMIILRKH